jgi:hypothetical protein
MLSSMDGRIRVDLCRSCKRMPRWEPPQLIREEFKGKDWVLQARKALDLICPHMLEM